ncbi:hypothetical protein CYMTET_35058, partial [Cymbomonas tetramitiformis]
EQQEELRPMSEAQWASKHSELGEEVIKEEEDITGKCEWEEKILVRGKNIESLSGAEVKQTLLAASTKPSKIPRSASCTKKAALQKFLGISIQSTVEPEPEELDPEEAVNVKQGKAVLVARKVMEKFGEDEHVDDVDEEKLLQKNQTQQILDSLRMLTVQVQEVFERTEVVMDEQRELREKLGQLDPMQAQLTSLPILDKKLDQLENVQAQLLDIQQSMGLPSNSNPIP